MKDQRSVSSLVLEICNEYSVYFNSESKSFLTFTCGCMSVSQSHSHSIIIAPFFVYWKRGGEGKGGDCILSRLDPKHQIGHT